MPVRRGYFGAAAPKLEVAVKVVSKEGLDKHEIRWFRDEIAIHKKLRHPNICMLHGAFEDLRKFTMVLSLCHGGSLCDTMGRAHVSGEPLSESAVRHAFSQLVAALRHCHGLGIVHRDVKLDNCCWTTAEERVLQLIDFGYASTTDVHTAFSGSAHYAAPEVHLADAHGGPSYSCSKSDTWSAGVCLFAMLATQLPFGGDEETEDERDALREKVGGRASAVLRSKHSLVTPSSLPHRSLIAPSLPNEGMRRLVGCAARGAIGRVARARVWPAHRRPGRALDARRGLGKCVDGRGHLIEHGVSTSLDWQVHVMAEAT